MASEPFASPGSVGRRFWRLFGKDRAASASIPPRRNQTIQVLVAQENDWLLQGDFTIAKGKGSKKGKRLDFDVWDAGRETPSKAAALVSAMSYHEMSSVGGVYFELSWTCYFAKNEERTQSARVSSRRSRCAVQRKRFGHIVA